MTEVDISTALEAEIDQARQKGQEAEMSEPRAVAAWYAPDSERVFIELTNGVIVGFPCGLLQGLVGATAVALAEVEVTPSGSGLHWEALDVDLGVPQLVAGIFGTKAWMTELARKGGGSKSVIKAKASRENGKRGGRPRKNSNAVPT